VSGVSAGVMGCAEGTLHWVFYPSPVDERALRRAAAAG